MLKSCQQLTLNKVQSRNKQSPGQN